MNRNHSRFHALHCILVVHAMVAMALMIGSCRQAPNQPAQATTTVRIVSLSPAISRALVDLHLQDRVIGRTPFCSSLDQSIPAVGDLLNLNYEHLIRLQPTHILVQPPQAGINQKLLDLAKQHGWTIGQWKLNTLDDIETMVREIPPTLFPDKSHELQSAAARAAEMVNNIAGALAPGDQPLFKGRTLLVFSTSPVSVCGEETYLHDVLRALGGVNAIDAKGWASISLEDVVRLNPDAIIVVKPGDRSGVRPSFGPLFDLETTASEKRRMAVLKHPDSFLPSSSVIEVAAEMREILQLFAAVAPE